ncbi:hypothetical protein BGX38DRAFT_1268148 [Terfezia claveryi]|nr:hypothetical protein BGX38DRAFT_1268148 [Terfezia claveryi]
MKDEPEDCNGGEGAPGAAAWIRKRKLKPGIATPAGIRQRRTEARLGSEPIKSDGRRFRPIGQPRYTQDIFRSSAAVEQVIRDAIGEEDRTPLIDNITGNPRKAGGSKFGSDRQGKHIPGVFCNHHGESLRVKGNEDADERARREAWVGKRKLKL